MRIRNPNIRSIKIEALAKVVDHNEQVRYRTVPYNTVYFITVLLLKRAKSTTLIQGCGLDPDPVGSAS